MSSFTSLLHYSTPWLPLDHAIVHHCIRGWISEQDGHHDKVSDNL